MDRHSSRVAGSSVELEAGGELNGAQGAQAVLGERRGIDGAQDAALQVALSVERIEILRRSADPSRSR